jgi:hypothetical protein
MDKQIPAGNPKLEAFFAARKTPKIPDRVHFFHCIDRAKLRRKFSPRELIKKKKL